MIQKIIDNTRLKITRRTIIKAICNKTCCSREFNKIFLHIRIDTKIGQVQHTDKHGKNKHYVINNLKHSDVENLFSEDEDINNIEFLTVKITDENRPFLINIYYNNKTFKEIVY